VEHLNVGEKDAEICAAFARGNLGKAIHLASSDEFKELYYKVMAMVKNVESMDIVDLMERIREIKELNFEIGEVLDMLQLWYRDVLMFKVTKDMNLLIFKDEYKTINGMGQKIGYEGLEKILDGIETCRTRLDANVNMELAMELLLLTMKRP
jgi:DNA polymerase-3 subunit delta'